MEKRLFDIKEAAGYLGMTESALYKKVWKRQVPFVVKIGRALRFDKVRMDEWIEDNFLKVEKPANP
jgi:excisionase family DNA binding protein